MRSCRLLITACLVAGVGLLHFAGNAADPGKAPVGPLSPREELATFKIAKGFKVELVASEPDVIDPVAMAFDEDGRLYVVEMIGYPNGGVATGNITSGRIRMLTDPDGKGVYTKSTIFADGLRLPSGLMPYKGGLLVANPPDLMFFEGPDAAGKSKGKRTLYTGFDISNSEQLLSNLQWGLDNWVYACAGSKGGEITSKEKADAPVVTLRSRGIRFHPEVPGSLEPMSGGGQYGLAANDWQQYFTNTNSQHLRHIVLPDQYLRRNPYLPVSAVTLDIPDHGAACKVHRISPFEAWRVERTAMRAGGTDAKRFPSTELIAGGYITSGCSPVIYNADLFPESYRGNSFMCEPANNLIHRDILVEKGATYVAELADKDAEFLASTDIWFRPVALTLGPDGAIYVADFYREVIETPLSLSPEMLKKLNMESRARGRIWRIVPDGTAVAKKPSLSKATSAELVAKLGDANSWQRLTAQRLLMERQDKSVVPALVSLAREAKLPVGRAHALWTLHGLKSLDDSLIEGALKDPSHGVREQALRLAEERVAKSAKMRSAVTALADDDAPRVRFQLAFTLGEADAPEFVAAWTKLARRDGADPWMQTALLSSANRQAGGLLESLARDKEFTAKGSSQLLGRLAGLVGAKANDAELGRALALLVESKDGVAPWQAAVLDGLGQGLQNSGRSMRKLWEEPPASLKDSIEKAKPIFARAAETARTGKELPERIAAVRLLASGPFSVGAPVLRELLTPQTPSEIQLAAVRALGAHDQPKVGEMLLAGWNSYSPFVQREAAEVMLARPDRIRQLLDAIGQKKISGGQLETARLLQLRKHPNAEIAKRAQEVLANLATPDRQKIVDAYKPALELTSDAMRGKMVFKRVCVTCHRLENEGVEVGPDLLSALKTKTRDGLIIDILDPSREVDPRYINYVVSTKDGRVVTGMIAVEAPSSITIRRAEKAEDVILRTQIEEIQATAKSLMPDELEKQITKQDLADLIEYLMAVAGRK